MRERFHVPANYFLTHSVGCLPTSTQAHVQEAFYQPWQSKGGQAWDQWLGILSHFRENIGTLLGTSAAHICPQTNVSSALTKILYSLPKKDRRNVIVLSEQDFPTIGFVLNQAVRQGFQLRFVEGDPTSLDNWQTAIRDDVHLVHVTHALSNTSHLLPVAQVCTLSRENGAFSVVDIAQSAGIVWIDTTGWQPDFMIGTSVKFICGGPGACFLYASPDASAQSNPIDVGWFSHENPFEMDIHHFKLADDAMRFLGGTPSPAPFATAAHALDVWQEAGLSDAQAKAQDYLDSLLEAVPESILRSPKDRAKRGGTLAILPTNPSSLQKALVDNRIIFDQRKDGFRFSVHGYTNPTEIDRLRKVFAEKL